MRAADKLRVTWSRREHDTMIHFPLGFGTSCDGHYMAGVFGKDFIREMTERGYDITTVRFQISPKVGNPKFRSQRPAEESTP